MFVLCRIGSTQRASGSSPCQDSWHEQSSFPSSIREMLRCWQSRFQDLAVTVTVQVCDGMSKRSKTEVHVMHASISHDIRSMGDVDYLDPILADAHALQSERFASIIKALLSLLPPPPAATPSDPSRIVDPSRMVLDRAASASIAALPAPEATPQQPTVCDTLLVSPGASEVCAARDVLGDTGVSLVSPTTMATGGCDLEAETRRVLAQAVMRRNDASLRVHRGIVGDDAWEGGGEVVGGLRCAESVQRPSSRSHLQR